MPSIASETVANFSSSMLVSALQERLQAVASVELSNFLPSNDVEDEYNANASTNNDSNKRLHYVVNHDSAAAAAIANIAAATYSEPRIESLVASSAEDLNNNFRDITFDIFDDEHELFGSPLAFDASEHGLWNGRFVPPPPRPPFFVDEPVLSDGLTTCDLCSWAMPTKSTFIFEGTIEKATELGWPLTLIIVSMLSAVFGAIIMVFVVRCRRKKSSNNRNDTHVQWWSRNKRPNGAGTNNSNNNNHLRRSNIYTAHPADSIRGLPQPTLSASSSLTAMTAMVASVPTTASVSAVAAASATAAEASTSQQSQQYFHPYHHHHQQHQQQQQQHHHHHLHQHQLHQSQQQQHYCQQQQQPQQQQQHQQLQTHDCVYEEHEYHQPQELQLQLQHQRQHSSSMSSVTSTPSLLLGHANMLPMQTPTPPPPPSLQPQQQLNSLELQQDVACHWPNTATMVVAS